MKRREPEYTMQRDGFVEEFFRCNCCHEVKSEFHFALNRRRPDGSQAISGHCNACRRTKRLNTKCRRAEAQRTYLYGLSEGEYDTRMRQQRELCALCGKPPGPKPLVVDHDHVTGAVRGLIHQRCNLAIGFLGDNIDGIKLALAYLERANDGRLRDAEA